ncbi:putative GTP diphosphokinase RSH1, chloroplastic isoform X3 [Cryptomeria japonica]|uniref:putative GTP diphosphokinase RSH1, chloroplastic isoform X3 n=1 Tax=Cryptomeria japonica TaxID=3369 RepID=UPI0025ACB854|nr:putative GTP diphosphokinase RSH1, chloroplastic isoform X3 [Cryptomeria japonica]
MACTSLVSVSLEAVNVCKVIKVDGGNRSECNILSCAWKAPRILSGSFASTTQRRLKGRNNSHQYVGYKVVCTDEVLSMGESYGKHVDAEDSKLHISSRARAHTKWRLCCSSQSSSKQSDTVSIKTLWEGLKPTITYLPSKHLQLVEDALKLAFEAHAGQKRRSGEPFIIHPVEVARILGELELDWESIAAGLLHDTVEDSNVVSFERIEDEFGPVVRRIVEGETKVSKLGKLQCTNLINSAQDVKANDLRQMFLAMTEEVRVIIVKLADRLHNMRTLSHMPPHKQCSIASETLKIFAPLAKLLGMYQIKSELEALSFLYTNPGDFADLKKRVEQIQKEQEKELSEAKKVLIQQIEEDQFLDFKTMDVEVVSVCKELYSIYKRILETKGSINEVNEIAQLRIILKPKRSDKGASVLCSAHQICYHVLGLVHGIWTPIPRAMKDYIATPKPNGYQSLQTKVIPFLKESTFRVEVQIRTEEMDRIAEKGIAVHYSGKRITSGSNGSVRSISLNNDDIARRVSWLNAIREWQEEFVGNMSPREFVDTVTVDLLGSRVFVFTPKGEIKNLPKGATVIDYAYQIHSEVGNKMISAKVNGNAVSPFHTLANAEVVEIITDNVSNVDELVEGLSSTTNFQEHELWLQYAKTRSARHKIMKFLKEQTALKEQTEKTADDGKFLAADIEDIDQEDDDDIIKAIMQSSMLHTVNGNCNKLVREVGLKLNGNSELLRKKATIFKLNIPQMDEEILVRLEKWKAGKVANWHGLERRPIQWFNVCCIDRKGMLTEVTSVLAAAGIVICACVAETDQTRGLGVMLFHIDGNVESMVKACSSVDSIQGVLSWSVGCTWHMPRLLIKSSFEC